MYWASSRGVNSGIAPNVHNVSIGRVLIGNICRPSKILAISASGEAAHFNAIRRSSRLRIAPLD
jgi:hypothetical protein